MMVPRGNRKEDGKKETQKRLMENIHWKTRAGQLP